MSVYDPLIRSGVVSFPSCFSNCFAGRLEADAPNATPGLRASHSCARVSRREFSNIDILHSFQ